MENVRHCRAMGSLFRQFAVFDPVHSWKYLIEAQKWEHLAEAEIASHFNECNSTESKAHLDLRCRAEFGSLGFRAVAFVEV